jgi:hypothetical protein
MTGRIPSAPRGPDDPHPGVADRGGHRDPLFVDRRLLDRRGLDVLEELARRRVVELIEKRRR